MTDDSLIENKSSTNYILEYIEEDSKRVEIFLFSGDQREIKNRIGQFEFKISTFNNKLKNYTFFVQLPGNFMIENAETTGFTYFNDFNSKKRIPLKVGDVDLELTSSNKMNSIIKNIPDNVEKVITINKNGKNYFTIL